jgi:HK97 family phage major capsid protein
VTTIPTADDVRTSKLGELRMRLDEIDAEILLLDANEVLSEEQEERDADLWAERATVKGEHDKLEARAARADEIRGKTYREIKGVPQIQSPAAEVLNQDIRSLDDRVARDAALRVLSNRDESFVLEPHQQETVERIVRKDTAIARRVLVTENDGYRSAWQKYLTQPTPIYNAEEQHALLRYDQYRIATEGTTSAGGFAIPVFIDPSIILTDQESNNPFLAICRQVTVNTNQWKGVSAAGMAWSFDAETAQVSDDMVTLAQPTVGVYTARGFIPYSLEIEGDWPGFQAEMSRLLATGYDELLLQSFTTGAGSAGPRGIVTALDANTNDEVSVTTAGSFGQEDIYKLWKNLPQKYRRNASWMMSVDFNNRVRQAGTSTNYHAYTVGLPEGAAEMLFARPVYENDKMASYSSTTTGAYNLIVVGDFSNYVIARNQGMSVELVPHLMGSNDFPRGMRGWFAHARIGGNSVNDLGFRLLTNTA